MERDLIIPIPKKKGGRIYGTLRGSINKPLVVFVHGLAGNKDEHIFFNGTRFFEKHGFSSFRFNLYDWHKGARTFIDCGLSTHAEDLDTVVGALREKGAKHIVVVGHSFGGLTVLLSKQQAYDAAVLWDPSGKNSRALLKAPYIKELGGYDERWQIDVIIGHKMGEEIKNMKWDSLAPKVRVPTKIIAAGKSSLQPTCKRYLKQIKMAKALAVIKGANHTFDEDGAEEQLFEETLKWVEKYGK